MKSMVMLSPLAVSIYSWASVKQQSVALFTTETEYMSASEATTQAIWLRFVLQDLGEEQIEPSTLMCDITSAIAMSESSISPKVQAYREKVSLFYRRCNSGRNH